MKKPSGRAPKRRVAGRATRRSILVVPEGKKTEPEYFTALNRAFRQSVSIKTDTTCSGCDPLRLVKRALKIQSAEHDYDELWCVFDVDNHTTIEKALELANAHNIRTAVSNPCFELWLVLHMESQTGNISGGQIQHKAKQLGLVSSKGVQSKVIDLENTISIAIDRARKLEKQHRGNGKPSNSNPSSGVFELVALVAKG